jgi:DNA-binding transcriptional LysR family regulator
VEELDLNLLAALDALLSEGSVTGAARRLRLSASAMSRTLARLRAATGDPLLVRAGRALAPTPHALALRARVPALLRDAQTLLRPVSDPLEPTHLKAIFTLRAGEWFTDGVAPLLAADILAAAPHVRLRFLAKTDKDLRHLREGAVDLEVGAFDAYRDPPPEVRSQLLLRDRFVGAVRTGHPLLRQGEVTRERFAACEHVGALQRDDFRGPIDDALETMGLERRVVLVVPSYGAALRMARATDLVAVVPSSSLSLLTLLHGLIDDEAPELAPPGLQGFALPTPLPEIVVSALWHPRMDADPAHRWLRSRVTEICRTMRP